MSLQKRTVTDMLLAVQIICTLVFGGSQFLRMLSTSQGVSVTWFGSWEVFLVLNLVLAIKAHRNQPSRVTFQTILSYAIWVTVVTLDLGVMVWKQTGTWNARDNATVISVTLGVALILCTARVDRYRLSLADPVVKGYLALCCKGIPQLIMAYNILLVGGSGLAGMTLIMGHVTVCTRLGQLWFSIREAGWDRNRIGSAISESANEVTWMIVTIVWLTR